MRRAAREKPRLTALVCAGAAALVLLGTGVGAVSAGDTTELPSRTAAALSGAEKRADREAAALRMARDEIARLQTDIGRADERATRWKRRAHTAERRNADLRRALVRARRTEKMKGER